jgi:hypothetical protein
VTYGLVARDGLLKVGVSGSGSPTDPDEEAAADDDVVRSAAAWAARRYDLLDAAPVLTETCLYTNTPDGVPCRAARGVIISSALAASRLQVRAGDREPARGSGAGGSPVMTPTMDRILTTHVGSMPRPQNLVDMLFAQDRGEEVDEAAFDAAIRLAVSDAVDRQLEAGVDIPSDGEMSKIGYGTNVRHRLSGFDGDGGPPRAAPADIELFPPFKEHLARRRVGPTYFRPVCRGPVALTKTAPLERDLERRYAVSPASGGTRAITASGRRRGIQPNGYATQDDYLERSRQ